MLGCSRFDIRLCQAAVTGCVSKVGGRRGVRTGHNRASLVGLREVYHRVTLVVVRYIERYY